MSRYFASEYRPGFAYAPGTTAPSETAPITTIRPERSGWLDLKAGTFRTGTVVDGKPTSLGAWRITTGLPTVAARVGELAKAEPREWDTKSDERLELVTQAKAIKVTFDADTDLEAGHQIWPDTVPGTVTTCAGQQVEVIKRRPVACDRLDFDDKKSHARNGHLCKPSTKLTFRLAAAPEIGFFSMTTGAWGTIKEVPGLRRALQPYSGQRVAAILEIKSDSFTKDNGEIVSWSWPSIRVTGPTQGETSTEGEAV